jgi:hypothetical protein
MATEIKKNRKIDQRWTKLLAARFTPVSDVFLENYSKLKPAIKPVEAMFIIHLLSFKWDRNDPFPSFGKVAGYMGISAAAVRAYARSLENKGYLKRRAVLGRTSRFDLKPLFAALEAHLLKTFQDRAEAVKNKGDSQEDVSGELMKFVLDAMNKVGLKPAASSAQAPAIKTPPKQTDLLDEEDGGGDENTLT